MRDRRERPIAGSQGKQLPGFSAGRAVAVALVVAAGVSCDDAAAPLGCPFDAVARCWTSLGLDTLTVTALGVDGGVLLAGTFDGLLRFDAQSGQWIRDGLAAKTVTTITGWSGLGLWATVAPHGSDTTDAVAYWRNSPSAAWSPRDGGLSAQTAYHGLALSFAMDPVDPNQFYLGMSLQVARSTDGGASWSYVYGGPSDRGGGISGIALAGDGSRVYAGGQGAMSTAFVLRSDDHGGTWSLLRPRGLTPDNVASLATDPGNPDHVLVGMRSALWASSDAGVTWSSVFTTRRPGWVRAIVTYARRIFALADEDTTVQGQPSSALSVHMSSDGGATWEELPVPPAARGGTAALITADRHLIVGTRSGLWSVAIP